MQSASGKKNLLLHSTFFIYKCKINSFEDGVYEFRARLISVEFTFGATGNVQELIQIQRESTGGAKSHPRKGGRIKEVGYKAAFFTVRQAEPHIAGNHVEERLIRLKVEDAVLTRIFGGITACRLLRAIAEKKRMQTIHKNAECVIKAVEDILDALHMSAKRNAEHVFHVKDASDSATSIEGGMQKLALVGLGCNS